MMKYLAIILSLYVVFLCSLQCQDEIEVCCKANDTSHKTDNHHDNDCHSCSPFCVCNCCHANTLVIVKKAVEPVCKVENAYHVIFSEGNPQEILQNIWQPPKIIS